MMNVLLVCVLLACMLIGVAVLRQALVSAGSIPACKRALEQAEESAYGGGIRLNSPD